MTGSGSQGSELLEKWQFNWGIVDVLIGGKSSIDLTELRFRDSDDARTFLRYYGWDPDNAADAAYIHAVIIESIHFIQNYLMPAEWARGIRPPEELLFADDARDIILAASGRGGAGKLHQAWACALLRVMHTIAHIEGVRRLVDFDVAREQIMSRFRNYAFRSSSGELCFGTEKDHVVLHKVDWKNYKSRESVILKLLHKKANVAETIYDFLGIRLVTKKLSDIMLVLKYLRNFHIITFPNCNPGRARNTLIDVDHFKKKVDQARRDLKENRISPEEFLVMMQEAVVPQRKSPPLQANNNPHSGSDYRSVQLTCRQVVRIPPTGHSWLQKLDALKKTGSLGEERRQVVDDLQLLIERSSYQSDFVGFFPFEVHILDQDTYFHNHLGSASHDYYKRSQIRAARRRVLHQVLALSGM